MYRSAKKFRLPAKYLVINCIFYICLTIQDFGTSASSRSKKYHGALGTPACKFFIYLFYLTVQIWRQVFAYFIFVMTYC